MNINRKSKQKVNGSSGGVAEIHRSGGRSVHCVLQKPGLELNLIQKDYRKNCVL